MIREFINNNGLKFTVGNRNTTVTTLIGYSQHLGKGKMELKKEIETEISEDSFINEEIDRLWNYCANNNYANYWTTAAAKSKYKF